MHEAPSSWTPGTSIQEVRDDGKDDRSDPIDHEDDYSSSKKQEMQESQARWLRTGRWVHKQRQHIRLSLGFLRASPSNSRRWYAAMF
jgi:hypothetical protein